MCEIRKVSITRPWLLRKSQWITDNVPFRCGHRGLFVASQGLGMTQPLRRTPEIIPRSRGVRWR
jgi:hypothetical protein